MLRKREVLGVIPVLFLLASTASPLLAKGWHLQMETSAGRVDYVLDEELGAKVAMMPGLYALVRSDLKSTIFVHTGSRRHAVRGWDAEGGAEGQPGSPIDFMTPQQRKQFEKGAAAARQKIANLPPEARRYAQQAMKGKIPMDLPTQPENIEYKPTGETRRIDQYDTQQVIKVVNGQPSGDQYWVAQVPDWEMIAAVVEETMSHMSLGPGKHETLKASALGGLPILMIDQRGQQTKLVSLKEAKVTQADLSPPRRSQEVELMQLMSSLAPAR